MSELRRRGGRLRRRPRGPYILVPPTPGRGSVGGRSVTVAGFGLLRWRWGGAQVCIVLTQRAVSPLAMLLERLRLHHLTAVATHDQVEIIVSGKVTEDGHVCKSHNVWAFKMRLAPPHAQLYVILRRQRDLCRTKKLTFQ